MSFIYTLIQEHIGQDAKPSQGFAGEIAVYELTQEKHPNCFAFTVHLFAFTTVLSTPTHLAHSWMLCDGDVLWG